MCVCAVGKGWRMGGWLCVRACVGVRVRVRVRVRAWCVCVYVGVCVGGATGAGAKKYEV